MDFRARQREGEGRGGGKRSGENERVGRCRATGIGTGTGTGASVWCSTPRSTEILSTKAAPIKDCILDFGAPHCQQGLEVSQESAEGNGFILTGAWKGLSILRQLCLLLLSACTSPARSCLIMQFSFPVCAAFARYFRVYCKTQGRPAKAPNEFTSSILSLSALSRPHHAETPIFLDVSM